MNEAEIKKAIRSGFPLLKGDSFFKKTSECTDQYNCIGWAAGDNANWWWPIVGKYWPPGVARTRTLDSFIKAFGTKGYEECDTAAHEEGFEKIAIYCSEGDVPEHAARQLENGKWTSKLGDQWDIRHGLPMGVSGKIYGQPRVFMRRPIV